ncbi:MAG: hypothetical protein WKG52_00925 [Variovorax sp.]
MTIAQRIASICRHLPYLTPFEQQALAKSQAECIATSRTYAIAARWGAQLPGAGA